MSEKERAVVEAELAGTGQVVANARAMRDALAAAFSAGKENGTALGNTLSNVTKTIAGITDSGLKASGVLRKLDVGSGVAADKEREKSVLRLSQASVRSREELKAGFAEIEKQSGVSQAALVAVSGAVADLTGDTDFAISSISGLADVAAALGTDVGDQVPLFAALHNGLGVTKNAKAEVDKLYEAGKALGTIGGPKQLLQGIALLGPELDGIAIRTDKDRERFVAFYGAVSKGAKTPQQAAQRVSEVLGSLKSNAAAIQYSSGGKRQVDDKGRLLDPLASLAFVQDYTKKKFGSNAAARERANIASFGPAVAGAVETADTADALRRVQASAATKTPSAIRQAARDAQNSDVGNRDKKDRAAEGIDRSVGHVFNRLGDYLNRAAGPRVAAQYSTLIGTFGGDIAAGAGGKGEGKGDKAGGYGGKLVSAGVSLLVGSQLAALGDQYEQQDALKGQLKKSDRQYAEQQAAEAPSAAQLEQAGGNEALAVALRNLPKETANELAAVLTGKTLKVKATTPIDPNAPTGELMTRPALLTDGEHFAFENKAGDRLDLYGTLLSWTDSIKTGVVEKQIVKRSGSIFQKVGAPARRFEFKCRLVGKNVTAQYRNLQGVILYEPEGQLVHPRLGDMPAVIEELSSSESPGEDRDVIDFSLRVAESGLRTPSQWSVALAGGTKVDVEKVAAVTADPGSRNPYLAAAVMLLQRNVDAYIVAVQAAELGGGGGSLLDLDATLASMALSVQQLDDIADTPPLARRYAAVALSKALQARNAFTAGRPAIVQYRVDRAVSLSNLCQNLYGGRGRAERDVIERINRIASARLIPAGTLLLLTDPTAKLPAD